MSIDAIITQLEEIVEENKTTASPNGYFAALYLRVTRRVKQGIEQSEFEDPARMERLDVIFAQRYLNAYRQNKDVGLQSDTPPNFPTASWQAAFDNAANRKLIILQHLLLGMNAHINLDLGIAAKQTAPEDIHSLKSDFMKINAILGEMIDDTQRRLTRFFSAFGLIDHLLGRKDEKLALFSLQYARDKAWQQALELAHTKSPDHESQLISERDQAIASFAQKIAHPPLFLARLLLAFVRLCEKQTIPQRIQTLAQ
ncbi:MAG: DUF5995 family protein [Verrucomicrobiota bacterium]